MAAKQGKDLLLKVQAATGGDFETVAGMRSRSISFNADTVDVTDFESAGRWRELLAGAGVQRASISGTGLFKDTASDALIRSRFFASEITDWQITIPDFGVVEGPFQISTLEYGGQHNGEVTFEMGLESAGQIAFTALS